MDEEDRALVELGKAAVLSRTAGQGGCTPLRRNNGYAFAVSGKDGRTYSVRVLRMASRFRMLSVVIDPKPGFTTRQVEEAMVKEAYAGLDEVLGELPLLVFGASRGRFGVHICTSTRPDVVHCTIRAVCGLL
jgi:hypothetical protein